MTYWENYWSIRNEGGHRYRDEAFLQKEANEKLFHLNGGKKIMDFGCGSAELLVYYAPHYEECLGVDMSSAMLSSAKKRIHEYGLESTICLKQANNETVWEILTQNYDRMTTAGVMQYLTIEQIEQFICNAKKYLSNGGRVCLFDIIDPRLLPLFEAGAFQTECGAFYLCAKLLQNSVIRLIRKIKTGEAREIGYAHHPDVFLDIANKYNFKIDFPKSIYYEYRYHVILY